MTATDLATALGALSWVGEVVVHDVVDSTNLDARRRLDAGGRPGLVVVADRQTAGRGRRGRTWEDVDGGNVAVSAVVEIPTGDALVALVAALALRDALGGLGLATSLKWPNDVRVVVDEQPRKCAGILVEAHATPALSTPALTGPTVAVVGVGVDLDWRGAPRGGAAGDWTSLAEARGGPVSRDDLVVALLERLGAWLSRLADDPVGVRDAYREACDTLGQRVQVEGDRTVLVGRAVDLTPTGALVLDVDGREHVVTAGDVVHLRPA